MGRDIARRLREAVRRWLATDRVGGICRCCREPVAATEDECPDCWVHRTAW